MAAINISRTFSASGALKGRIRTYRQGALSVKTFLVLMFSIRSGILTRSIISFDGDKNEGCNNCLPGVTTLVYTYEVGD